jgi:chaperonin cofactor prefoldin
VGGFVAARALGSGGINDFQQAAANTTISITQKQALSTDFNEVQKLIREREAGG